MDSRPLPSPAIDLVPLTSTARWLIQRLTCAPPWAFALREVGLPPHDVDAVRRMIGEGQRVLIERAITRAAERAGVPASSIDVDDVLRRFRAYYSDHLVVHTVLYPGVVETLRALHAAAPAAVRRDQQARRLGPPHHRALWLAAVLWQPDRRARRR